MFCKHKWNLLSETITESKFEHVIKQLERAGLTANVQIPWQLSDGSRKHIQTFTCEKCGGLKRFTEDI